MNFLHMLANIDAYHASLVAARTSEKTKSTTTSVRFVDSRHDGVRPTSVQSVRETVTKVMDVRPKSGKSLSFQLGTGRVTPALSVSTADFQFKKRDVRTPISARRFTSSVAETMSTITEVKMSRDGARSPTPNAITEIESAFQYLDPDKTGFYIWRIQGTSLHCVEDTSYGFFHEGNAYIVLNINRDGEKSLHCWTGGCCTERNAKFAMDKAEKLDKIVGAAHICSREVQGNESTAFFRLFPDGVIYIEGRHKTSPSKASCYEKRMYIVTGRKYARAECVRQRKDYLTADSLVILDNFPRIYVWIGRNTEYTRRNKAIRIARKLQLTQRRSRCHVVIIDEADDSLCQAFKRKFDDIDFPNPAKRETEVEKNISDVEEPNLVLYRISGDRVMYDMPAASKRPLNQCYLTKRDSYLLDRGKDKTLFIWVGSEAKEEDVHDALKRAKLFSTHHNYPTESSICRIRENHEPPEFKRCFCDWKERISKEMSLTKRYSAGNIGRALFSRTDRRTIATTKECWSEDTLGEWRKNTQVWVLNNNKLEEWEHMGLFTNSKCFILLHTTIEMSHYQFIIYLWIGSKSTQEDEERLVELAEEKNNQLENRGVQIRVLDHKEPQHFLTALQDWMIVYDGDETNASREGNIKLFCVRDFGERATRIQQVAPAWENLNSSSSFVLLTDSGAYLWYGKNSGSTEREAAKHLLSILCSSRMFSYEIAMEGKEPAVFVTLLGARSAYEEEYKEKSLSKRPACLLHYNHKSHVAELIDDFQQEDLSEEGVYILDTYSQVFVWCGERVDSGTRKKLFTLAKDYIKQDPAGRQFDLVSVWLVSQRTEPFSFTKHFTTWNALGYAGRHAYEVFRKRVRQENAKIDVHQSVVDTSFLKQPKYPYITLLRADLPHDVDDTNKQNHLSEKQFQEHLKISRLEFYRLPLWKQSQILRSARLFYSPSLTTKPFVPLEN
ncbi:advillin-like isoform X2 [Ruditapes philippinarum]|uniref:advillin-like isoform X2 n=1 Tax=Ruditapes philippinarum TaxID=129788 RepID=UPI00295C1481|nr:advillin-like isoform X2 [Ruditapes philippinarum]